MGGAIVLFWAKLGAWIRALREEQGRVDTHEWFEWLAEQIARRSGSAPAEPAYVRHRGWRA